MNNWNRFFRNYRWWQRRWFYPTISVVVALSLCLTTSIPGKAIGLGDLIRIAPQLSQIFQLSSLSDRDEVELGKQINDQLVNSQQVRIYRNRAVNNYVNQIGQRLVSFSDCPNLPYTFQVVDDNAVNAFATLGGFVYVNTGLLKTADNEAELASVIGHEMGHIGGKHALKQMKQKAIQSGLLTAAGLDRNTAIQIGVQVARDLPRSRNDEFDADKKGLKTLTKAGYSQDAMVSFMKKLLSKSSGSTPAFLSTHPATSDRIASLKNQIQATPTHKNYGLDNSNYKASVRSYLR